MLAIIEWVCRWTLRYILIVALYNRKATLDDRIRLEQENYRLRLALEQIRDHDTVPRGEPTIVGMRLMANEALNA